MFISIAGNLYVILVIFRNFWGKTYHYAGSKNIPRETFY